MENRIKKKIKHHLIVNGSIRAGYQFFLTISGVALIFLDVKVWDTDWIMYFGLVLAGIGGLSARAETLKIKPFEENKVSDYNFLQAGLYVLRENVV